MKKNFLLFFICFAHFISKSQSFNGNWQGDLDIQGAKLPIIFHITMDSTGKYSATFDSPKQQAFKLPCSNVLLKDDSVRIEMKMIQGFYSAMVSSDKKQMSGNWNQGGVSLPLLMRKTSDTISHNTMKRPQTPGPAFSYHVEEVEYNNAEKTMHYGGTLTVPIPDPAIRYIKAPTYPTVLLITGSGQQDRDETIFEHKPFAVIADHLTKQGFAVLRVDDRGTGKTGGNFSKSTTLDFVKDAEAGINFLKTRIGTDTSKIGLIGHSEGGMIAPMIAAKRKDIKFIVLLAGPGVKIADLMEQQNTDITETAGVSKKELEQYRLLYKKLLSVMMNEKDSAIARKKAVTVFKQWQKGKSETLIEKTTAVTDEKSLQNYIAAFTSELYQPWFNYFIRINPALYLSKLTCPVLALNGEKDLQVAAKPNLAAIKAALTKAKNSHFKTQELPGLNHLFQHCKKCTLDEYATLEETFAPGALTIISDWIKTILK